MSTREQESVVAMIVQGLTEKPTKTFSDGGGAANDAQRSHLYGYFSIPICKWEFDAHSFGRPKWGEPVPPVRLRVSQHS